MVTRKTKTRSTTSCHRSSGSEDSTKRIKSGTMMIISKSDYSKKRDEHDNDPNDFSPKRDWFEGN